MSEATIEENVVFYKPQFVCQQLNLSYSTVYSYIKKGLLEVFVTPTGKFLIPKSALDKFKAFKA